MPQKPKEVWSVDEPDDEVWSVSPSSKPVQQSSKSIQKSSSFWETVNKPLWEAPSRVSKSIADKFDAPTLEEPWKIPFSGGATWRGLGAGMMTGVGDLASSFTSPLELAIAASTMGAGTLAKKGLTTGAKGLSNIARSLSGAEAIHGGQTVLDSNLSPVERATGLIEMAGGAAGAMTPAYKKIANSIVKPTPDVIKPSVEPKSSVEVKPPTVVVNKPTPELVKTLKKEGYLPAGVNEQGYPVMKLPKVEAVPEVNNIDWVDTPEPTQEGFDFVESTPESTVPELAPVVPEINIDTAKSLDVSNGSRVNEIKTLRANNPGLTLNEAMDILNAKNITPNKSLVPEINQIVDNVTSENQVRIPDEILDSSITYENGKPGGVTVTPQEDGNYWVTRNDTGTGQSLGEQDINFIKDTDQRIKNNNSSVVDELESVGSPVKYNELTPTVGNDLTKALQGSLDQSIGSTRLNELVDKSNDGSLTYDELGEARQLDGQLRDPLGENPTPDGVIPEPLSPDVIKKSVSQDQIPQRIKNINRESDLLKMNPDREERESLIRQGLNFNKSFITAYDVSGPGRQGKPLITTKAFWTSIDDMFKAWGSERALATINQSVVDHPSGYFKSGVDNKGKATPSFAEKIGLDLQGSEEYFKTRFELFGMGASRRAYEGFFTKLRSDHFVSLANDLKKGYDIDIEKDLPLASSIAEFINNSTGRGSNVFTSPDIKILGMNRNLVSSKTIELNSTLMNELLFSPKFQYSKLHRGAEFANLLLNYQDTHPFVKKQYLKSLFGQIGYGTLITTMAGWAGAEIINDPTSTDFRKIKIGNNRHDVFGGDQQYLVAAARILTGQSTSSKNNETKDLTKGSYGRDDVLTTFATNKLNIIPSLLWAWMQNREFDGKEFEWKKGIVKRLTPMIAQDFYEIVNEDPSMAPLILPAIMGENIQTYGR